MTVLGNDGVFSCARSERRSPNPGGSLWTGTDHERQRLKRPSILHVLQSSLRILRRKADEYWYSSAQMLSGSAAIKGFATRAAYGRRVIRRTTASRTMRILAFSRSPRQELAGDASNTLQGPHPSTYDHDHED